MAFMNHPTLTASDLAFGGMKNSDYAREPSGLGIQVREQNTTLVRIGSIHAPAQETSTATSKLTMKAPPQTEKDHGRDAKAFAQRPANIKELELLQHDAEKSTGPARVALNKLIEEKSKQKDA